MSRADRFDFTLDEETEKRLYDLLTDMDTRNTNRFWITDKRGYHAEYVKVIRCKDCKYWLPHTQFGYDADWGRYHNYCERHLPDDDFYAFIKEADDFCSWAKRKEE